MFYDVLNKFKIYKAEAENQLDRRFKILRSDKGGEYTSNEFAKFCEDHGIIHKVIAPSLPKYNSVAERKNEILLDMVNALILSSIIPQNLYREAILSTCHILN